MSDDLPTLLLPIKANSGLSGFGHLSNEGDDIKYLADFICIRYFFLGITKLSAGYFAFKESLIPVHQLIKVCFSASVNAASL